MPDNDMNRFILDKLEKVDDKLEEAKIQHSRLEEAFLRHEAIDDQIHESVKTISDNVSTQMSEISSSLARYNDLLQDHMRRTELAEASLSILHEKVDPIYEAHQNSLFLKNYKNNTFKNRIKWLGAIATGLGVIMSIMKLMEIF